MTTQLAPHHLDLPPPSRWDLLDMDRVVGWIDGHRVGFLGFADEHEAASAAWLAYRTVSRRMARRLGIRPIPIDTEPLVLAQEEHREVIVASGRPIATLLRPGVNSRNGSHTFGFTVDLPAPVDELTIRSTAYAIYRALRKSGLRWALWARDSSPVRAKSLSRTEEAVMPRPRNSASAATAPKPVITVAAATAMAAIALVTLVVLFVTATAAVTVPIAVVLAVGALTTAVLLVRDRRRRNDRGVSTQPGAPRATAKPPDMPGWDELGILSVVILSLAFLVPPALGLGLLAVGVGGLFVFRIAVMYRR